MPAKIIAIDKVLEQSKIPHAFGGALALAWCTQQARGTVDIDLNLFVGIDKAEAVRRALPKHVRWTDEHQEQVDQDGQTRLHWDRTPIDIFFATHPFHDDVAARIRWEPFEGIELPFLSCTDLAIFKVLFDRTRDWADLEDMAAAGTLDTEPVLGFLVEHFGPDDPRVDRLLGLTR